MRAVVCTRYGGPEVLELREAPLPTPARGEVRVKVNTTAVTASDCITRAFSLPRSSPLGVMMGLVVGFRAPRNPILGMVLSGEVESIGAEVTSFAVGDKVFAFTGTRCGAYAEFVCVPERSRSLSIVPTVIAHKPTNLSDEEAVALLFGGLLASSFLARLELGAGTKLLVYGASGSIGSAALQLAKHAGAFVTAVCGPSNVERMKSLGADDVLDYTNADCADIRARYDFIFDAVGKKKTSRFKDECAALLAPGGRFLSVDDGSPRPNVAQLLELKRLAEVGALRPVIDRCYSLEQIVEAHRYVDEKHKRGNVVITVAH
jgi:NADPH:quinone reductase-like Zn-dependent oxidoreductase